LSKLAAKNVSVIYSEKQDSFTALQDVSFVIEKGTFVSILGPSGCGKSTILSLFAGLGSPSEGSVLIGGEPVSGTALDRSVVFQHYSLFPWMSARKNIELAVRQAFPGKSRRDAASLAAEYIKMVGLPDFADKFPSELSGGMQQRVSIARALAMDSAILLMDEPFGALDSKNRADLQSLLLRLWEGKGEKKTVLFVTHDIDEAILLSDRIIVMASRPGRVREEITVPFSRPRDGKSLNGDGVYAAIRNRIVSLFYEDITGDTDGKGMFI
jgi:NitT/TauT family transport system ATP-binding protein